MPWVVESDNVECDGWAVVVANDGREGDGDVVGCHDTEAEAEAQVRALNANVEEDEMAGRRPRTFRVAAPTGRRPRQFAAGNVPRDANGRWISSGGGVGPGVGAPDRNPAQIAGEKAGGAPVTNAKTATKAEVAAPSQSDRTFAGPEAEQLYQSTDVHIYGDGYSPHVSVAEKLPNEGKGMNLGQAYDSLGGVTGAQERLMYSYRTGGSLAPVGYGTDYGKDPVEYT